MATLLHRMEVAVMVKVVIVVVVVLATVTVVDATPVELVSGTLSASVGSDFEVRIQQLRGDDFVLNGFGGLFGSSFTTLPGVLGQPQGIGGFILFTESLAGCLSCAGVAPSLVSEGVTYQSPAFSYSGRLDLFGFTEPLGDVGVATGPFTMTGLITIVDAHTLGIIDTLDLSGSGIATVTYVSTGDGRTSARTISYAFISEPRPALGLVAGCMALLAAGILRRRRRGRA